jgi:hypothetical protein
VELAIEGDEVLAGGVLPPAPSAPDVPPACAVVQEVEEWGDKR